VRRIARSVALSLALIASAPAWACDCVRLIPGSPSFNADLDAIAKHYPWRFTPTREYRGPKQASYRIELASDCSLAPDEMKAIIGRPVLLLLSGGPDRYEAGRCVNLRAEEVEAAIRKRIEAGCVSR
jgi:hypothetical protein